MHFTESRNLQAHSRLLQLPYELRQKILRYLLKHPDTFKTKNTSICHSSWSEFVPNVNRVPLTGQLLQTCQQMYFEASKVLYNENALHIDIGATALSWERYNNVGLITFRTFAGSFRAFAHDKQPDNEQNTQSAIDLAFGPNKHGDTKALHRFTSLLRRIANVRVTMRVAYEIDVYLCCRTIESICRGKDVIIHFKGSSDNSTNQGFVVPEADILRSCKGLRCRKIQFEGLSNEAMVTITAKEVTKTIIGDQPSHDIFRWYYEFRSAYLSPSDFIIQGDADTRYEPANDDDLQSLSKEMEIALVAADFETFMNIRDVMIGRVKTRLREYTTEIVTSKFSNGSGTIGEAVSFMQGYVDRIVDDYFAMKTYPSPKQGDIET